VDPANTGLGHRLVQRWNLPEGWVISARPAHPALVILLARQGQAPGLWNHAARQVTTPAEAAELIDRLRSSGRTVTYDPQHRTLRADTKDAIAVTIGQHR
jgi:hypothetical protein